MPLHNLMGFGSGTQFTEATAGVKPNASQKMTQPVHSSVVRNAARKTCFIEYLKK